MTSIIGITMRIHYLQHHPLEDWANMEQWAKMRGYIFNSTQMYKSMHLPKINDFDWLVIMGGPMNVYEDKKYPWLVTEKRFIEKAIQLKKVVVGICLGAQLIATVLGAKVYKNKVKEIGWFPVQLLHGIENSQFFTNVPKKFMAFHWHEDTFDIPKNCRRWAKSKACENQAFTFQNHVIAIQFHVEVLEQTIKNWLTSGERLIPEKFVQSPIHILAHLSYVKKVERIMNLLLTQLEKVQVINN